MVMNCTWGLIHILNEVSPTRIIIGPKYNSPFRGIYPSDCDELLVGVRLCGVHWPTEEQHWNKSILRAARESLTLYLF
jgi:hypothetical protein